MLTSSTLGSRYLSNLDRFFDCYVWDWSHTWSSAAIYPKLLGSLKSDRGRFIPFRVATLLLTTTNVTNASAANVGIYTSTPSPSVDSVISSTSVTINSSTFTPGEYALSPVVTAAGSVSLAPGTQIGIDLSVSSATTTCSWRTWLFGYYV